MLRLYSGTGLAANEATCNLLVVEADKSRKFLRLKRNKKNGADSTFNNAGLQADRIRRKVRLHEGQKIQNKRKMSAKTRE
jgi:L-2-hydroxyglutarate oxidase LhgO